jgi:hypothetical protein
MFEIKNLWLNLTVVIPGLVTYGTWRLLLFFVGEEKTALSASNQIDQSLILSACLIFAIALIQQAFGITIEALLTLFFYLTRRKFKYCYRLFYGRFSSIAKDEYTEGTLRTIGQFFLSLNLMIGQALVLLYFLKYEDQAIDSWVIRILYFTIAITLIVAIFRCWNAKKSIQTSEEL